MLDVIISRHTWNCQIRTHIHTGYTHTGTHTQKEKRKSREIRKIREKKKEKVGKPKKKKEMWSQERKTGGLKIALDFLPVSSRTSTYNCV